MDTHVDLAALPQMEPGHRLLEHRGNGVWYGDPGKLKLHLSSTQRSRERWWSHDGRSLRKEMQQLPAANLNVARYLVSKQSVPWTFLRRESYTFWGTLVENTDNTPLVPRLYKDVFWKLHFQPLYMSRHPLYWYGNDPAVLMEEQQ